MKPAIQPPIEVTGFQTAPTTEIISILEKKLKSMHLFTMIDHGSDADHSNSNSSDSLEIPTESFQELNKLIKTKSTKSNHYRKKPLDHHYYKKPTPQDILFEENNHLIQSNYQANSIYE